MTSNPPDTRTPTDTPWHQRSTEAVLQQLDTTAELGLDDGQIEERRQRHGRNQLPEAARRGPLKRFLSQFHNALIYVLLISAGITLLLEHYVDSGVIVAVVLINAVIGFIQEGKAEQALNAVRAMLAMHATVIRNGERREIDAVDLVPGDIVLLESGNKVPADLRLVRSKNLRVTEAALTGESLPVGKQTDAVAADTPLAERTCMAYSGTVVTFGQAQGVVTATGRHTEIGRIGALVAGVETLETPLTRRLNRFSHQITAFILVIALTTFLYGHYIAAMPAIDIFLAVVGLAVAAIPEGLPAVVTITLAIGTGIMAKQRAIVRRLPAVETLGSVSVICTDKTGTLTTNEMTAVRLITATRTIHVSGAGYSPEGGFSSDGHPQPAEADDEIQALARCALLCNDAQLYREDSNHWTLVGDPTEGALLSFALKAGLDTKAMAGILPRVDAIPFESEHRFMATLHHDQEGKVTVMLKGAPERVLALCCEDSAGNPIDPALWQARIHDAANEGQRVLALAMCRLPKGTRQLDMADITCRFTLLGMIGMIDPARPEAIQAVRDCQEAGMRVIMITGDHAITAAAIGRQLGLRAERSITGDQIDQLNAAQLKQLLSESDVIARASPEHKLRLIESLQAEGRLVAMTGDGVNDAPALKAADIGVAMGLRGTDAAKEAADLVLTDDNFATIARAVREGRTVFDNIKKALLFILPTNGGEAGVILIAVFAGLALPVTAAQILWVNMVTAVTLALALAFEPAERNIMQRPPTDPKQSLITPLLLGRIAYVSLLMVLVSFAIYYWEISRGSNIETARTAVVNMLVMGEIVYLFNIRHFTASAFTRDCFLGNRIAIWACVFLIGLQLLMTYSGWFQGWFQTQPLDAASWGMVIVLALAKFLAVELEKAWLRHRGIHRM